MSISTTSVPRDFITERALAQSGIDICRCHYNERTPLWHYHPGYEIVLPSAGFAEVFYGSATTIIEPGEGCIGPADIPHGASGTFTRTVIHFDPNIASASDYFDLLQEANDAKGLYFRVSKDSLRRINWIAQELHQLMHTGEHRIANSLLGVVLTEIQVALGQSRVTHGDDSLIEEVIHHMKTHVHSPDTVDVLADRFGVSRTHLWSVFRENVGCSPGKYWLRLKMDYAASMLSTGEAAIEDVASTIGFHSLRGFQRAFFRHFGVSPAAYRDGHISPISVR